MKSNSILFLVLMVAAAAGLCLLAFFGIGQNRVLGVGNIRQGMDLKGGVSILYEADAASPTREEMNAAVALIQRRLDGRNYTEAEVGLQGLSQIRVDIPGVEDAEQAVSEIGATALLAFVDEDGGILLTGGDVSRAAAQVSSRSGSAGSYVVALEFTPEGTQKFSEATRNNVGKIIYIYLDQEMISNPTVNAHISEGQAVIENPGFTAQSAEALARSIREGSLPFALNVISVNNIGAKLGADALSVSVMAGLIGAVLVLIIMAALYRVPGVAADLALTIYIALVMILISMLRVTLTLPGIAGIILSVGMAVDANIIIFERMREEIYAGRSLKSAIETGYKRALPAIIDFNITTLIAAAILFWLGTGPVKGFAQTLSIGVAVSMFTALTVTQFVIKNLTGAGIVSQKLYVKVKKEAQA